MLIKKTSSACGIRANAAETNCRPDRSEIIDLTLKALGKVSVDYERAFKQNFVTNGFNGSKDFLVSDRLFRLVSEDMIKFRK